MKKLFKALLFPHVAVLILLTPISIGFLIYAMLSWDQESIPAILSYVLAAYTLTLYCVRIPGMIHFFKALKEENQLFNRISNDAHFRIKISLFGSFFFNAAYSLLQLGFGIYEHSVWYIATAAYYLLLALMRIYLLHYTRTYVPGEEKREEYRGYRFCGVVLLILNAALSLLITNTVTGKQQVSHGMIPTIAMAAYTFTVLTVAIVNVFRYRKYRSPVFSAAKNLNLATAVVSMLTLESAMLSAFDDGSMGEKGSLIIMAITGFAVMIFTLGMAVYMTLHGSRVLSRLPEKNEKITEVKNEFR